MDITFLGHAGFLLSESGNTIAIDPFLSGNPTAVHKPDEINCDYIALTHGHADHLGDTVALAHRNNATVIAAFELANYLADEHGVQNLEPANPGGAVHTDFGWVAFTHAFHSSSYDGRYTGMPCGLVIRMGDDTFYHCGDTGLFGDMQLYGELYKPDVAAVPIGDRFTMDARLGTRAAELIRPRIAIPIHYGTFSALASSAEGFAPAGVEVRELKPGHTIAI